MGSDQVQGILSYEYSCEIIYTKTKESYEHL